MKKFLKSIVVTILTIITAITLFACAPSTIKEAKNKMEDLGYTTIYLNETKQNGLLGTAKFMRVDKNGSDIITVFLYDSAKTANSLKGKYQKTVNKNESVSVDGKWIIIATENAKKDFQK